jgi:predicted Zn-dependent protease with MMP-like domain
VATHGRRWIRKGTGRDAAPAPQPAATRAPHRDRHGRGLRGPLAPPDSPLHSTRAEQFDDLVADAVERVLRRWAEPLAAVEFVVEDVPRLDGWVHDWVPLSRSFPAVHDQPARVVVYRRPIEARGRGADDEQLRALVQDVVVDEVAELLGVEPELVDPDLDGGPDAGGGGERGPKPPDGPDWGSDPDPGTRGPTGPPR